MEGGPGSYPPAFPLYAMYSLRTPDISYATEPAAITLAEIRAHLALGDQQTGQDAYLTSLIPGAQRTIENEAQIITTARAVTATFRVQYAGRIRAPGKSIYIPLRYSSAYASVIGLTRGPMISLTSVHYAYDDPKESDLDVSADWTDYVKGGPFTLPSILCFRDTVTVPSPPDTIRIVYQGGHTAVPPPLKIAMMQLIADWAQFRGSAEELLSGRMAKNLPGAYLQTLRAAGYRVPSV